MNVFQKPILVVNTHSRLGRDAFEDAKRFFEEHRLKLHAAHAVEIPGGMQEIVRTAIQDGSSLIILGGGDGTISSVVDDLAYKNVTLGILPMGTANSFARTLDIPLNLEDAVKAIVNGRVSELDLGKINNDYFANSASIGLSTKVAHTINPKIKKIFGKAGYYLFGFSKFLFHEPFNCTLKHDGKIEKFKAMEIYIANGRYHGGILVAEDAHLKSHDIHVRILTGTSIWSLLKSGYGLLTGTAKTMNTVEDIKVTEAELITSPRYDVSIDGEVSTQTPIKISVAPKALKVLVPKHS